MYMSYLNQFHSVFFFFSCHGILLGYEFRTDHHGPRFVTEPGGSLVFSNSSGGRLDCSAEGMPAPQIEWVLASDGSPVVTIPGARLVFGNGSLVFPSFRGENFRPDVHSTSYRCSASSSAGRIVSMDVQVRAVVVQKYEAQVYNVTTLVGNAAVFRCHVSSYVKDYLTVTSWLQDDTFNIYPTVEGDSKYVMFASSGNLHIFNVTHEDARHTYRCRTLHKLTDQTQESITAGRIIVQEPDVPMAPWISEKATSTIVGRRGDYLIIPCVAQGSPAPSYGWQRKLGGRLETVYPGDRKSILAGSLMIRSVQPEDSGMYICSVNNSAGAASVEVEVAVSPDLTAHIVPNSLRVDSGVSVEFTCVTTGNQVKWYKNGQKLMGAEDGPRITIPFVQREDEGMYQCFASLGQNSVQAVAELRLSASKPQLVYQFIEQTLQPGPDVSLKCVATGQPTPQIQWTLDGFPVPQSERFVIGQYVTLNGDVISHVNITRVTVEDGGVYKCSASNRVGTTTHKAPLRIYGHPVVRKMPPLSAVAGEPLYVSCPAAGYPIQSITWEKDGRQLPVNHRQTVHQNGTLVIENVQQKADHGTYTCQVTNRQGISDRGTIEISVMEPPFISPFSIANGAAVRVGERLGLQCLITKGDTPLTIRWLKDKAPLQWLELPALTVTSVGQFSSSLLIENLTTEHSGVYTCEASNAAATATHSVTLAVNVPPEITPFIFPEFAEGARVQVTCNVHRGDLPLNLTWLKDWTPISSSSSYIDIIRFNMYSSILTMSNVGRYDSGNYTCVASNPAKTVSHTATLTISVPPEWTIEPRDTTVISGQTVALHCQASGFPRPQIMWRKGKQSNQLINSEPSLENGTLVISPVLEQHEGYYLCEANNGIGAGLSAVVFLTVNELPRFISPLTQEVVKKGDTANLFCETRGDKPIQVTWKHDGQPIPIEGNFRFHTKNSSTDSTFTSQLNIKQVSAFDGGKYVCFASNPYGTDETVIQLIVQDVPSTPENIRVLECSSRTLKIAWSEASTTGDNNPVLYYAVVVTSNPYQTPDIPATGDLNLWRELDNLQPATTYRIHVVAVNKIGPSSLSDPLVVTTDPEVPSGPPVNVTVSSPNPHSVKVVWSPPAANKRNGPILGYYVGIKQMHNKRESHYNYSTVKLDVSDSEPQPFVINNLRSYTKYKVTVQSFNIMGPGPNSPEVIVQTRESAPAGVASTLNCISLTSQSLQIAWAEPPASTHNGIILGYKVYFEKVPMKRDLLLESDVQTKEVNDKSVVLTNLDKYSNYSIKVAAFTKVGMGPTSAEIHCITAEDIPSPPSQVSAALMGPRSCIVAWSYPLAPNGEITQFNVYQRVIQDGEPGPETKRPFLGSVRLMLVNTMQNHSVYEWRVTAATKVGESGESPSASLTPSSRIPAAIVSFGSTIVLAHNSNASLDCHVVGSPRPKLTWSFEGHQLTLNADTHVHANGTLTVAWLTQAHSGNYTCVAHNSHGSQSISYYVRVVSPPTHPALDVLSTTWNNITLMWSRPFNVIALLGYVLKHKPVGDGDSWREIKLSSQTEVYSVNGLFCGSKHQFTIAAFNRVGLGTAGPVLEVSTLGSAPIAPPNHLAVSSLTYSLTIHLERWQDGDCPLSHFVILRKQESDSEWYQAAESAPPGTSFVISGLEAATLYRILIKAINNAGTTTSQYKVSTLTVSGAVYFEQADETLDSQYVQKPFYLDARYSLPILASFLAFIALASAAVCIRSKHGLCSTIDSPPEEREDISKREYYTALQQKSGSVDQQSDRIPEYEDEIYPYATFQVTKSATREAVSRPRAFQTFVYQGAKNMGIDNYAGKDLMNTYSRRLFRPDIDEYDSLGSDSDSRHDNFSAFQNSSIRHNKLINALESSTSNEPSPCLDHRKKKDRRLVNSPKKKNLVVLKNNCRSPETSETAFSFPSISSKTKYYDDFCKPECDLQSPPIHYRV